MPASTKHSNVDVLVVGAGPSGLMCSYALAKTGIKVRVVEKRAARVAAGHADGILTRTLEILQSYGLAERLMREGNEVRNAAFYSPGAHGGIQRVARVPSITASTARYHFGVTLHQGAIEAIFLDAMKELGLMVDRQTVPLSMHLSTDKAELSDPNAYPVEVVLQCTNSESNETSEETVNAKYVVGADGAHSWVRKSMEIAMEGAQTEHIWGAIDFVPKTDLPDVRNLCIMHSNNGTCLLIPREDDGIRLYVQLSEIDVIDPSTGRVDPKKMGPADILEVARKSIHPYQIAIPDEFEWSTVYIIGQRVAERYSNNERIFIVGDACHTHSPKAGQGMNASIADSHNLAWKLAQVLKGTSDFSLLKTYELERRQFALDLIDFDRKWAALMSSKVSHEEFFQAFKTQTSFTSGLFIQYPESAIVNSAYQSAAKNIIVGQRIPSQVILRVADAHPFELQDLLPADTRFKLLLFTGDITSNQSSERARRERLAEELMNMLTNLSVADDWKDTFDVITIATGKVADVDYLDAPLLLRSHWSKVFVDTVDFSGRNDSSGKAYDNFGIESKGAVIVVRPDGYVGAVFPLDVMGEVSKYFVDFMRRDRSQVIDRVHI